MRIAPQINTETLLPQRKFRRFEVNERATFEVKGRIYHCAITDISGGGAGLTISPMVQIPEWQGVLTSQRFGAFVCSIRYQSFDRFGVQFVHDTHAQDILDEQLGSILGKAAARTN